MGKLTKNFKQFLFVGAFSCAAFLSCQKAVPAPYGTPAADSPKTITPPTFTAEVDNSFTMTSFTPIKIIQGGYVTFKGVSTNYTITISLPVSDGPGNYDFGFSPNIRATITSGGITYVDDANVFSNGSFDISSISQGKYNATFNFSPSDSTNISNRINVFQGSFTNL